MVQYADDSIKINEEEFCKAFRSLPKELQDETARAFTLLSMKLFYPESPGKESNPRANEKRTDPDAYMTKEGNKNDITR